MTKYHTIYIKKEWNHGMLKVINKYTCSLVIVKLVKLLSVPF